jgi:hypothetical protein
MGHIVIERALIDGFLDGFGTFSSSSAWCKIFMMIRRFLGHDSVGSPVDSGTKDAKILRITEYLAVTITS